MDAHNIIKIANGTCKSQKYRKVFQTTVQAKRKKSKAFTDEENALILQWLENRYKDLYCRTRSSHVTMANIDVVKSVDIMKTVGEFCSQLDLKEIEWSWMGCYQRSVTVLKWVVIL